MGVERYGSKTDVVVKLVLVFFIALLSFSVGTFVGKKFSDNQHKLAQLEPGQKTDGDHDSGQGEGDATASHETTGEHGDRSVASVDEGHAEAKPQKSLSDDEIAKLAEEFVTDDTKPAAKADEHAAHHPPAAEAATAPAANNHGEQVTPPAAANNHGDSHAAPAVAAAPAPAHNANPAMAAKHAAMHGTTPAQPSKPAERMAEGNSPVVENPTQPTSRIPAALPKEVASSAIGKYTVQVASFPVEKEAQTLSASLKEQGFSAFYVSAKVKKDTYYRVSIGLFTTSKEADSYMKDLIKRKKVESAIVQKISSAE